MAEIKDTVKKVPVQAKAPAKTGYTLFAKQNYIWMLAGLAVMALGFILMAGGKSSNPNEFNDNEINGFRRITLAPLLIMAGLVLEIVAIMKKPKNNN